MVELSDTKDVWIVWTNTDRNEGRGSEKVLAVCETKATAQRIGTKGYVMGSNCPISKTLAIKVNNNWLVPGEIEKATKEDLDKQLYIDKRDIVLAKAKKAGLTEDELRLISSKGLQE